MPLTRIALLTAFVVSAGALTARSPTNVEALKKQVTSSKVFQDKVAVSCAKKGPQCPEKATDLLFCALISRKSKEMAEEAGCGAKKPVSFVQLSQKKAPEDELAKEMTHDLEMNFNKIAPFGKEDTAKELQDH